jgi:hypothetical protein
MFDIRDFTVQKIFIPKFLRQPKLMNIFTDSESKKYRNIFCGTSSQIRNKFGLPAWNNLKQNILQNLPCGISAKREM